MSLRQLRTRIEHLEHLEAKSLEPISWEERLRQWRQTKGLNEVERPLTEEENAELDELMYRFHPLGLSIKAWGEAAKAWREAAAETKDRDRRPRAPKI
jgi:hypothetical protein